MFALAAWRNGAELEQLQKRAARVTTHSESAAEDEAWTPAPQLAPPAAGVPVIVEKDQRCIGGQLFQKAGNEWRQLGAC